MARWSVWQSRKGRIQHLIDHGYTDAEVGELYGVAAATLCDVRKKLGIASRFVPRIKPEPVPELVLPQPVETYVDAAGHTVRRYPARYADGAFIQSVTARPRR